MNSPLVFLSYCHADDRWNSGSITAFRDGLAEALRIVTGKSTHVFQDRDIEWGEHWPDTLEKALAEATFLMPIVTPSYFESAACRKELEAFVEYEKHWRSRGRILPIYWRDCARWEHPEQRRADKLASELYDRQYRDWRPLVGGSPNDPHVREELVRIAEQIATIEDQRRPPNGLSLAPIKWWLLLVVAVVIVSLVTFQEVRSKIYSALDVLVQKALGIGLDGPPPVSPGKISYLANRDPDVVNREKELAKRFSVDTGITVTVDRQIADPIQIPKIATNYDVVLLDTVSVGELSKRLNKVLPPDLASQVWPFSADEIIAIPLWDDDVSLLYYRADLQTEAPQTWQELEQDALRLQKQHKLSIGFAWQGRDPEGLTCNALEWITSAGAVKQDDGNIDYNSEAFSNAINRARGWIKGRDGHDAISEGALDLTEEAALQSFEDGKVAFLRSWPSKYAELKNGNKEKKGIKFGVARLPHDKDYPESVGVLGGVALVVPQSSKSKVEALNFIKYMRSDPVRKWRIKRGAGGGAPDELKSILEKTKAVIRPSDEEDYVAKSKCFSQRVREAIEAETDLQEKMEAIAKCGLTKVRLQPLASRQ